MMPATEDYVCLSPLQCHLWCVFGQQRHEQNSVRVVNLDRMIESNDRSFRISVLPSTLANQTCVHCRMTADMSLLRSLYELVD